MESVLIAIGGNALRDTQNEIHLSTERIETVCRHIVNIRQSGYLPVLTFGNGPQVGNLLNMAETTPTRLFETPVTLDTCVSWTQGEIGYRLSRELERQFKNAEIIQPIIALNTRVEVDPQDPAFQNPTKPVGQFINAQEAQRMYEERGWLIGPDANRGYRRMVPSPKPLRILEQEAIQQLVQQQWIVLCCGGGGIPVKKDTGEGLEAVIDKDFTSCLLAKNLKLDNLLIVTEVECVYLNFGQSNQTALRQMSLSEAARYHQEGHFSSGGMGPKVSAMMDYVQHGGGRALMTSLDYTQAALSGQAGTAIMADKNRAEE